jgi:hypothetical protein
MSNTNTNIKLHCWHELQQHNIMKNWNQFLAILKLRLLIMSKEPLVFAIVFLVPLLKTFWTTAMKTLFYKSAEPLSPLWSIDMSIASFDFVYLNVTQFTLNVTIPIVSNNNTTSSDLELFERGLNDFVGLFASRNNFSFEHIQARPFDSLKSLTMKVSNIMIQTLSARLNDPDFNFGDYVFNYKALEIERVGTF